jgi:hypothetical protein
VINFLIREKLQSLDLTFQLSYTSDPETGVFQLDLSSLNAKDLLDLNLKLAFAGLDSQALTQLKATTLDRFQTLFPLKGKVAAIAFTDFNLNYQDNSLFSKIMSYNAKSFNASPPVFQLAILDYLGTFIDNLKQTLGSRDELKRITQIFFNDPKSITVEIKPNPPFSYNNYAQLWSKNPETFLSQLNVALSFNNEPPFKFFWNPANVTPNSQNPTQQTPSPPANQ